MLQLCRSYLDLFWRSRGVPSGACDTTEQGTGPAATAAAAARTAEETCGLLGCPDSVLVSKKGAVPIICVMSTHRKCSNYLWYLYVSTQVIVPVFVFCIDNMTTTAQQTYSTYYLTTSAVSKLHESMIEDAAEWHNSTASFRMRQLPWTKSRPRLLKRCA